MKYYWRLLTGNLLKFQGMKIPDCTTLKFDLKNERIEYQARYSELELTFSRIKSWTVTAENFEDEAKSVMLRRWFD